MNCNNRQFDQEITDVNYCQNITSKAKMTAKKYNRAITEKTLVNFFILLQSEG